jgi:catechol 2,3-dioxygenase-like lactoylglutathione lyase family enzyme
MFLEHVNLTVSDIERSIGFYRDLLGLSLRWRGHSAAGLPAAHVGDDRCYLALFQAAQNGRVAVDMSTVGMNHFGFVVDDLDATRRKLLEFGLAPHHEADYEPGRRLYFFDPDGMEVELVAYDDAAHSGADAERTPTATAAEG